MRIYVIHSTNFDYNSLLYIPLQKSLLWRKHKFILPHAKTSKTNKSKEVIELECDLVIAEVTYPSTGMGIELGWADAYNIPILCLHKKDVDVSSSLGFISQNILQYTDKQDMIIKISQWLAVTPDVA